MGGTGRVLCGDHAPAHVMGKVLLLWPEAQHTGRKDSPTYRDSGACERFWSTSSSPRERDGPESRHHGAPLRTCQQRAGPLAEAPADW